MALWSPLYRQPGRLTCHRVLITQVAIVHVRHTIPVPIAGTVQGRPIGETYNNMFTYVTPVSFQVIKMFFPVLSSLLTDLKP